MDSEKKLSIPCDRHSAEISPTCDQTLDLTMEGMPCEVPTFPDISILILDRRSCLREALRVVLTQLIEGDVFAVEDVQDVGNLPSNMDTTGTTVLYCTVAREDDQTRSNLLSLRDLLPNARLCALTDHIDNDLLILFDELQLQGLIPSSYGTSQLVACLSMITAGVPFLPARMDGLNVADRAGIVDEALPHFNSVVTKLTPRQRQVLRYIAVGRSNKYIAAELSLRESTVKVHVSELMKRLGATSRTHAAYLAASVHEPSVQGSRVQMSSVHE